MADGLTVKADLSTPARQMQAALADLRPALRVGAAELNRRVAKRFASKRDPDGKPWKPWAPSTAQAARKRPGRQLMLQSRALFKSSKFVVARGGLQVAIGADYGKYHEQTGGSKSRRLPRRAFMLSSSGGLAAADEAFLLDAIRKQVEKAGE